MSLDTTILGQFAGQMMEQAAERYGQDDCEISAVGIALEVDLGDRTEFMTVFSDKRNWVQAAFFNEARIVAEDAIELEHDEGE